VSSTNTNTSNNNNNNNNFGQFLQGLGTLRCYISFRKLILGPKIVGFLGGFFQPKKIGKFSSENLTSFYF
jgi:hypothetical protein